MGMHRSNRSPDPRQLLALGMLPLLFWGWWLAGLRTRRVPSAPWNASSCAKEWHREQRSAAMYGTCDVHTGGKAHYLQLHAEKGSNKSNDKMSWIPAAKEIKDRSRMLAALHMSRLYHVYSGRIFEHDDSFRPWHLQRSLSSPPSETGAAQPPSCGDIRRKNATASSRLIYLRIFMQIFKHSCPK